MGNTKLFRILLIALLGLSALLSVLFYLNAISEGVLITWCYVLLAIASLVAIVFPIIAMVQNPKNAKIVLMGIVGLSIVFVIGYLLSTGVDTIDGDGKLLATALEAKMSETGLIVFYIMGGFAIITVVYAEVSKMFK
ncbi:MAG: hypothetical protein A3K10_17330 [Bacteroidetes bacterium RIFCSPLOWO2_12_FULL_31_6]|nr:MAG: hypothetical protein A3K10_17330 [Bacteroidetes bacterium RIFCSPLOWO2_12_FULL_31_6]